MEKNIEGLSAYLNATQWEVTVIFGAWVRDVPGSSLDNSFEEFMSLSLQDYMSKRRRKHPSDTSTNVSAKFEQAKVPSSIYMYIYIYIYIYICICIC